MEYFRGNGEDILKEAELLKKLSKVEGFLPYEGWQMEPITRRRLGYEIYLVGSYKRSLDKYIQANAFTHLDAVNLALDLCSALSICRQAGFLYVDLKPSNIYVSEKKEYRIGDLGFLRLDALRYASLPERYFSPYTPPELLDPMTPMNLTADTFAVGMILYQVYHDGHLPFTGVPDLENLPTPCQADYEMAEIIMKAIHPDPRQRWTDPKDLGIAIASYMERNHVSDVTITRFAPLEVNPEEIVTVPEKEAQDIPEQEEAPMQEETSENPETPVENQVETPAEIESADQEAEIPQEAESPEEIPEVPEEIAVEPPVPEAVTPDTQQAEEEQALESLSEDVARIITKANDIIAHEIPEDTAFPTEEAQPDPFAFAKEEAETQEDSFPREPLMEEEHKAPEPEKKKKTKRFLNTDRRNKIKKFFIRCFTLLILAGLGVVGFWYYQNIYLQTVDSLSVTGTQNEITVLVDTGIEESRLTVYCTDENGKRYTETVKGGKVTFSGLKPSTLYTVQVDMDGFHKVVGHATETVKTAAETQILSFDSIAGSEDGSVILNFTVEGDDPDFWNIRYSAEGEEERMETVTGHSAAIAGLTMGKVYTFTLDGGKNFDVSGETTTSFLASRLVLAADMTVISANGSDITILWNTPGDVVVENWNVRLYDGYGFEEQVTVTKNQVPFTGLDPATKYTVEVTAAGMTEPSRMIISADPLSVSDFRVEEIDRTEMKVTWDYTGTEPQSGWLLTYMVEGSDPQIVPCEKASAKIKPLVPGANYRFILLAADDRTVFNNRLQYQANAAEDFSENKFVAENVSFKLLKTPEDSKWYFETVEADAFTDTFAPGDSASMVMESTTDVYLPGAKTRGLFVFRDSYGNVIPDLVTEFSFTWKNIWLKGGSRTAELDIPQLPNRPGTYGMELYFNGGFITRFDITISQ